MLKLKVLPRVLEQANTGGLKGTMLVNSEGSILASAGENVAENKTISAIAANIWNSFSKSCPPEDDLQFLLLECEEGSFVATRISSLLLVLYGDNSVGLGMLKIKATKMKEFLREPLSQVAI
eukprot:CAMPEP_0201508410 /NCGR_PEP_ID=MMETSP0161_2-20130828/1788_1 /ASSEMBLY_ACC=CAM_ASM_000251 /TAXON_ID=180227 /ORGANISM="Neoparamoeba aestuarina, Strain SoJaBio B1-5/56/2" /LENGTH=121 /DNA_ID=CAMNT_0047903063 /DNA_START=14 /DNA_END=379 /DNA_ORIENTATION=-